MSDDKITEEKPTADGLNCPAAQTLCSCGARGCPNAAIHALTQAPRRSGSRWRTRR